MFPIDTNNRMKEIAGNLRRDVKDLLGESANIVTGLFKDGLCTVRGAANRWRNFTRDISGAFVSLFKSTNEALLPDLSPEQQPIVTVMESMDENLPVALSSILLGPAADGSGVALVGLAGGGHVLR